MNNTETEDTSEAVTSTTQFSVIEEQSHESTGPEIDSLEFTCSNDEQSNRSEDDTESSSEQPSLPSVSDPSLWVVKCRLEKERLCAISLMNKSIDCRINKRPLSIFSVTVSDKVAGVLYIEAFREIHVREAIKGIENIYQSKIQKVPKKEMHQVYKMDKADKVKIKRGLYVRVNKGLYSGDLAQVIHPSENCIGAICKIVPRLKIKEELPSNVKGYFRYNRPPKQLFGANLITADEIQECFHETIKKRVFKWNKMCFRKGFLIKYFPLKELEVQNPNPKLKEVQSLKYLKDLNKSKKHDDSSDSCNEDDANALNQITEESSLFSKGEIIKVIEGELANMKGKIESVSLNEVSFKPEISNFKEMLDIDINLILKHFNVGDSVRAIYGYYKGEKGLVTKVSGEKVTIFSHILMKEFVINANYLKLSSEISEAVNKEEFNEAKNEFCVYSIVKDANYHRVNIVLDVEKDSVKVMDEDGDIKYEFMKDLQLVRYAKRNVGVDQGGNKISVGDSVKVVCGVNQGCKATIVYINRNSLFLKNKDYVNTLGVFVDRCSNVLILGHCLIKDSNEFMIKQGKFLTTNKVCDALMSEKKVYICSGEFKGQIGRVVSESDNWVNVELQTQSKIIRIARDSVQLNETSNEEDVSDESFKRPIKRNQNFIRNKALNKNSDTIKFE